MQIHSINSQETFLRKDEHKSFFRFLFLQAGNGSFITRCGEQPISQNCLLWLCPGESWEVRINRGAEGYELILESGLQQFFHCDPQLICHPQFIQMMSAPSAIKIDIQTGSLFNLLLKTMSNELERSSLFGMEIIQRYLNIFLLHLLRQLECIEQNNTNAMQADTVQRFQRLVEKHFTTKKQVSDYAAQLSLSPNYLNAVVKKLTGHPASYHIKQRIVLEAKRRGAYTDMCMKQVAYELGFDDIPHFSKYFKSATGMNFTDFRQEKYLLSLAG